MSRFFCTAVGTSCQVKGFSQCVSQMHPVCKECDVFFPSSVLQKEKKRAKFRANDAFSSQCLHTCLFQLG